MKVRGLQSSVIFGPVVSRRYGRSLGVNLLPGVFKVCSFNCPYCECGFTDVAASRAPAPAAFPTVEAVAEALESRLRQDHEEGGALDAITLAGNGEPTLHPDFLGAMRAMSAARDRWTPQARLVALSNASTLRDADVREGLMLADERIIKLDAANDDMLRKVNAPICRQSVADLVEGMALLNTFTLQTTFVRGRVDNATDAHVEEWIAAVGRLQPHVAQVYTIDRDPADAGIERVAPERLDEIAKMLTTRTGVPCRVFH